MTTEGQNQGTKLYSIESERAILAAIITGEYKYINFLTPNHFFEPTYKDIFGCIKEIHKSGRTPDFIEVVNSLGSDSKYSNLDPSLYVLDIINSLPSLSLAPSALRVLQEKYAMRRVKELGETLLTKAKEKSFSASDIPLLLANTSDKVLEILPKNNEESKDDIINEIQSINDKIPTGFPRLDSILDGGLEAGWVFMIVARPSVGKSSMATTLTGNFLKANIGVSLISLEMSRKQIMKKILCGYFNVGVKEAVNKANLYIPMIESYYNIYTGSSDISSILQEIHTTEAKVVIIDYFGLITTSGKEQRYLQMDEISRAIKNAAMQAKKSIILLAQMNRKIEDDKGNRRPRLSDLWGSGEKDADQISFLHDPNAKAATDEDYDFDGKSGDPFSDIEWIIKKNRFGREGFIKLSFNKEKSLLTEKDVFNTSPF